MSELTPDLTIIASQLGEATRSDYQRSVRRRGRCRTAGAIMAVTMALTGTALAAGELTGTIELGNGQSAVPVQTSLGAGDPNLPYRYQVTGLPAGRDGTGPVYLESSHPLKTERDGRIDLAALMAARRSCLAHSIRVGEALVWVLDDTCDRQG